MVVLTDRIPQEVLSMNELEFTTFFEELLLHMKRQGWEHSVRPLVEDLEEEIISLQKARANDEEDISELKDRLNEQKKSIQNIKSELEFLLKTL